MTTVDMPQVPDLPEEVLQALAPVKDLVIRATRRVLLDTSATEFGKNLNKQIRYYRVHYNSYINNGIISDEIMDRLRAGGVSAVPITVPVNLSPEGISGTNVVGDYDDEDDEGDEEHDSDDCELCFCEDCGREPESCCGCCHRCEHRHENTYDWRSRRVSDHDSTIAFCTSCDHWCYTDVEYD